MSTDSSERLGPLLGASPAMRAAIALLRAAAAGSENVLVIGAAGTGKELVARALHAARGRAGAVVRVDAAGSAPLAGGPEDTLYLAGFDRATPERQAELLRTAPGAHLVTSSAVALADPRLAAVVVALPTLAERAEDIPLLVDAFVGARLSPACAAYLARVRLPGNVRQLRELVERAAPRAAGRAIEVSDLPEREVLIEALDRHDWNLTRTARGLDVALNTLKSRLTKHGLPRRRPV